MLRMNTLNILASPGDHRSILIIARRFYESMIYRLPSGKAGMRLGRSVSWAALAGRRAALLLGDGGDDDDMHNKLKIYFDIKTIFL